MNDISSRNGMPSNAASQEARRASRRGPEGALMPPVDVIEDAHGITLFADLPGVSRDKLHLEVEAGTLTIDAELALQVPDGLQSSHIEVGLERFRRSFTLSKELDAEKVSAELANGVLKLSIPKAEHAKPRRIAVQAGRTIA